MKKKTLNMLKKADPIRARRWYTTGKKDGMCGYIRALPAVPKVYREKYYEGHVYGTLSRETACGVA